MLAELRQRLQQSYARLWIRGEVSQISGSARGHIYFTLKDRDAVLSSVIWSSRRNLLECEPSEGLNVLAQGSLTLYPPKGQLQFTVDRLVPDGTGQYFLALERLRQKLAAEGLFEEHRKQRLPYFPRRVGVVTSLEGAVWHDIHTTLERRNPTVQLVLAPAPVQGQEAPVRLILALKQLLQEQVEVVILARGGGSWEDLMAFNHERLVRFLANYPLPLLTAIGHETDTSLCDLVADQRASTPTAAAEMVAPERARLVHELSQLGKQANRALQQRIRRHREGLELVRSRPCLQRPQWLWEQARDQLDRLHQRLLMALRQRAWGERQSLQQWASRLSPRFLQQSCRLQRQLWQEQTRLLEQAWQGLLGERRCALEEQRQLLHSLAPQRILERGYCYCKDAQGKVVTSVRGRKAEEQLEIWLSDGRLSCRIEQICEEEPR